MRERPHDLSIAHAVDEVADELGATSSRVAIAWTRSRSRAVHPLLGARTAEQLKDNFGAVDLVLPGEAISRLEKATGFVSGFPTDFIAQTSGWVFGDASQRLDGRAV